ncbi:Rieske 2Fe-2S domain-containing protein [Polynucleobacter paneuropaeus]|nr:Rieske 2Fe-2S domain-containing protein [Polynucleobacter paneuropaeus]
MNKIWQHENISDEICETFEKFLSDKFISANGCIVGRIGGELVAYDDVCDHNAGTLILDSSGKTATCPRHKWTVNLENSTYENGCRKDRLKVEECDGSIKIYKKKYQFPKIDKSTLVASPLNFVFNAHASVSVSVEDISIITDPWFIGSCFATGWWHAYPPSESAVQRLVDADLIFISHNHPDHLHLPTLQAFVDKNKKFLIPNFKSKSVENILRAAGYNNLIIAEFLEEIEITSDSCVIKVMLIKSGDERDDSSLLIFTKNQTILFGVDTNMPNQWILPNVDLVFTPFAGGASGFPSRIDNFADEKKVEISNANRNDTLVNHVRKLLAVTSARYVVPYAGFFSEAGRDIDVKLINRKNSVVDVVNYLNAVMPNIICIDPITHNSFSMSNKALILNDEDIGNPLYFIDDEYIADDIFSYSKDTPALGFSELSALGKAFICSSFIDSLTVLILPVDNEFNISSAYGLKLDFSRANRGYELIEYKNGLIADVANEYPQNPNNIEILRIREDSLRGVIYNGYPLEDLSIGFQIKMFRNPNVYNFKFWDYFTNHQILKIS